jgi:hypothetical protein
MAAPKRKTPANRETSLRHVWLAGLGLAVLARRQAMTTGDRVAGQADELKRRALALAGDARANVIGGLDLVRGQLEPRVVQFSAEVEARLAPVLDKLGLKDATPKTARTARKTAGKRGSRTASAKKAQPRRSTRRA